MLASHESLGGEWLANPVSAGGYDEGADLRPRESVVPLAAVAAVPLAAVLVGAY